MNEQIAFWVPIGTFQAGVVVFASGLAVGFLASWLCSLVLDSFDPPVAPWLECVARWIHRRWLILRGGS